MPHKRRRTPPVLCIEHLELRTLLSADPLADPVVAFADAEPNNTLDQATDLGPLDHTLVAGIIDGDGSDVDWFSFTLSQPSAVTLQTTKGTVGLYNNSIGDFNDRLDPFGHRLLDQASATDPNGAEIVRSLAAGTYFVAISSAENLYFNPFIEKSGLSGTGGSYVLSLSADSLDLSGDSDPIVLAVDASAMIVRFDLSASLPFTPTVELADANGAPVPLQWTNQNASTAELQVAPARPFAPGNYQAIVKDQAGSIQLTLPFQVLGTADQGNDTPATSTDLGDLEQLGLVQIVAVIGDDSSYDFNSLDPALNPGNDVDLYRFHIDSTDAIGLQAEVFAGRIDSPLDAGLSLYRFDPLTGHLQFLAGNNQSYNPTQSTNRASSLFYDPALTVGLTAGDYYLAVSQGANTPSPDEHQTVGDGSGIFDPNFPHSGTAGWNVGSYVLNVQVVSIPDPPEVTAISIEDQSVLTAAPVGFSVQFTEYMNLTGLAFSAFQATSQSTIAGVYIQDANGNKTFPRLTAYDPTSFTADFLMLDRLATGTYQLHLSGSQGLTNIAGGPLVGNTLDGDYVVTFDVAAPAAGTDGDPLLWTHVETSDDGNSPQQLGVIFPHELQAGVQIVRNDEDGSAGKGDKSDAYRFEILQNQAYLLHLSGDSLPKAVGLQLMDDLGHQILGVGLNDGHTLVLQLRAGTYTLHVGNWSATQSHHLTYRIELNLQGIGDNAPPLFSGPSPAVGIRLATSVGPFGSSGPGSGNPFPGSSGSGISGSTSAPSNPTTIGTFGSASLTPLNIERGLPRIVVPADPGNVAIAIPAFTSLSAEPSSLISSATRTIRRASLKGNGPEYRGLVRLADGPIGTVNPDKPDHLSSTMTALRKLNSLIGATFSSEVTRRDETKTNESRDRAPVNDATDSSDHNADLLNADTATDKNDPSGEQADQGESHAVRTPISDQLQSREGNARSDTGNDSAFILPATDFAELTGSALTLESHPLWAAGIGAVLLHLASDGVTKATSQVCPNTRSQVGKRHEKRLRTQQQRNTTT